MPSSFWSFMQNGQWSVDTIARSLLRRPFHRSLACDSCLLRNGVEHTHFPWYLPDGRLAWVVEYIQQHVDEHTRLEGPLQSAFLLPPTVVG